MSSETDNKKSAITFKQSSSLQRSSKMKSQKSMSSHVQAKSLSRLKMRKPSYGYGTVPGVRAVERSSLLGLEFKRPPLMYFNTYQLDSHFPFKPSMVLQQMEAIVNEIFTGHKYHAQLSPNLALIICSSVMRAVKALNFNRYRIITVASIAQKRAQSYNNAVSFIWDNTRDNYVDVHRENHTCILQVTTFGIYLD